MRIPLLLVTLAGLPGCTQAPGRYPSLLPRPIEGTSLAEPVRPPVEAAADPALDKQVADLRAQLADASKSFSAGAQDAEAKIAVSRGLARGSGPWLDAQVAMAALTELRRPTVSLLADLSELALQRGVAGLPPYPALDAAVAEASQAADNQQARIDALEAALGGV
jgi:hypothetical protein